MKTAPRPTLLVQLEDSSQTGDARRRAAELCNMLGLDETACGEVAIIVTELASNVIRHGRGGELLLRALEDGEGRGLEILALDKGPGIADMAQSLSDGYSTGGTPGTGFGAVQRMATEFSVQTGPGKGTAVLAVVRSGKRAGGLMGSSRIGAVNVPMPGEEACGDSWAVLRKSDRSVVMVSDGLGHGMLAAEASRQAVRVFLEHGEAGPSELLEIMNGALRSTRGAAVAVAEINASRGELVYAGIGNIATTLIGSGVKSRSMVSHNGIVGHAMRRNKEFVEVWGPDSMLVLASDGLGTQWQLNSYPGLGEKPASLIAGVLYRDHKRGRDDATVVVVR